MSLVNQMLQDLEHRRTAEAGISPLGGLSSSGASVAATQSINYLLMGATILLTVAVVVVLIYLFGLKQSVVVGPMVKAEVPVILPLEATAIPPRAELKTEPKSQQSVVGMKRSLIEKDSLNAIQTDNQSVVPAQKVIVKTKKPVPLTASVMSEPEEGVGSISIRKPASKNKTAPLSLASVGNEKNKTAPSNVNKTIRPLTIEQQAQMAFQDAVKMLGRGDESGAQQKLEKALSIEPAHMRARETLSALLLNTGRVSEAAETLSEGLRLRPASATLAKLYARVLVDQGDNDAAVAVLERARPLVASDPEYYSLLAVLYRGVGKYAQASQVYQQMLQVRPGVAVWWMGLALSEDAMGASAKALEAYQRAQRSGGLKAEVLKYVQSRIAALTPAESDTSSHAVDDNDGFED